jgi:tetratricopeptide (TPR) repeat protein
MSTAQNPAGRLTTTVGLVLVALAAGSFSESDHNIPAQEPAAARADVGKRAEAIRLNNLGVAYMNQLRFEPAGKLFEEAQHADPQLAVARLNQGIALLNLQRYDSAREVLLEATRQVPKDPRAWYNLGLLYKNLGQPEQAREAMEHAAQLDPEDADTRYFLGTLSAQLARADQAIAALEKALALNPYHASAEFGLSRAYQRAGNPAKAREHLARFEKLTREKISTPMSQNYGDQGKYSTAEQVTPAPAAVPAAIPVRFVPVAEEAGLDFRHAAVPVGGEKTSAAPPDIASAPQAYGSGACLLDFDGDGRMDVFFVNAGENAASALYRNAGGRFEDVTRSAGLEIRGVGLGCAAGDYDSDGWTDLAVAMTDGVRLFRNQGNGTFREVTEKAGLRRDAGTVGAMFVDYDHDGDLDLYVTRAPAAATSGGAAQPQGNILWRNNGNGTFTDWTEPSGLGGAGQSLASIATDFNNDRAIDLIVTSTKGAPSILLNPREGKFRPVPPWFSPLTAPAMGVAVFDFDKDGWMDVAFTHAGPPGLTLWRNVEGKRLEPVPLPKLGWERGWGLAALDYDDDGWVDLAAVGEESHGGKICLLRNLGPQGFRDVTAAKGLDRIALGRPGAMLAADYDGDGDPDLLVTQNGGPVVLLRNDGGNRNNWLRVSLRGFADNRNSIGTKVEIFAGPLYQKWEVQSSSGYLSQGATEILAGLGAEKQADIVRLLWPTGVLQDEVEKSARVALSLTEIDRRGSSCPILFAWNGSRYEFIADMIGPGIVGHWVGPGERNIPDPTEYLKVDGRRVRLRQGRLSFRLLEPMEEVVYLDQVRLLAVDHPSDVEVQPNEYFASHPPFPSFQVIASRGAHPPRGAWDEHGQDILPLLRERDHRYVASFAPASFKGFAQLHWIELDLGDWNTHAPLRLLLHGFTDYFTATSMYAADQANVKVIAPYVEALDAQNKWTRVVDDMGFPAGLARTMVADLTGQLPAGTRRVRIATNLKIYWDQVLVDNSSPGIQARLTEAPLALANSRFRGYPRAVEGDPPADLTYNYEEVSATGPYAHHAGNYTRYGDVRALLERADDHFVILGSGDEVALEFDPSTLPVLPAGWTRDYFFFADGFSKDMDFYAAYGDTVEPLPFHAMRHYPYAPGEEYPSGQPYLAYRLNFNTRQESGHPPASFRFLYRPRVSK